MNVVTIHYFCTLLVVMRKVLLLLIPILCLKSYSLKAQERTIRDSCLSVFLIGADFSGDIKQGDLKKRFGPGITVGGFLSYKTSTNWLFTIEYNYMYGSDIREKTMDNVTTKDADPGSNGYLINASGEFEVINTYESGNIALLKIGKILPIFNHNPNGGLRVQVGGGFMEHKIFFYWVGDAPPQLNGNYLKGYDRLTYGPAISQDLGYHYQSNNGRINFAVDLEAIEGFTYNQRPYDFDLMSWESKRRLDVLLDLKLSWFFPIYHKNSKVETSTFY